MIPKASHVACTQGRHTCKVGKYANRTAGRWASAHGHEAGFKLELNKSTSCLRIQKGSKTSYQPSSVPRSKIRRSIGPGRVRSLAITLFLISLLTPLPQQWILWVQSAHVNRRYCRLRATSKANKTFTGAHRTDRNITTTLTHP